MSERMVTVEVSFGNYAHAMEVFLRGTGVTFGERTMQANITQSTVEMLKERNILYRIVEQGSSGADGLPTQQPRAAE